MAYNRLQTMRENIEAIRLAFRLGVAGRSAQTAEEIAVLRKYAGFGGLKCILNDANDLEDAAKWSKSDIELFAPTVELRRLIHDYSKDDREFARYMDSLKASVLTAFYTPAPVIDAISDSLKQSGIEVNSFLEPSAGQGAFIDSFLRNDMYPGAEVLAYEKDLLTGKILSALHPSILTRIEGFEKIERDFNGYFDVAASNVPFGDFAVADPVYLSSKEIAYRQGAKTLHNYFFLKALDQVREGGLVAFIASQGVMNAASPFVRMELVKRADLVAALRLPNNTFSDNAGTDAGSDLIILQKHTGKKSLSADEEFFIQSVVDSGTKVPGNKFFQAFPQNVICTTAKVGTDPYGKPAIIYKHEDGVESIARDLRAALDESLRLRLNVELYNSHGIKPPTPEPPAPKLKPEVKPEPPKQKPMAEKIEQRNEPLLKQYQEMKKKHPDAILMFRVGDFYEIFGKDAVQASEVLGITLTRRQSGVDSRIELAGFPHHALDTYLPKLVRAGKRVAICEQLEDPKLERTTKQKVVETVTPNQPPKQESKPELKHVDPPKSAPAKEIETDGRPDYSDNPDPRLFAYNLFGELEPIGKPKPQPRQRAEATEGKPKPTVNVADIPAKKFRPLSEKELEFYGSLNWEDNPPINGFYETMMSIAHRQLEEMRLEKEAQEAAQAAGIAPGETYIEKTEGDFIPGGRIRQPRVTTIPIEPKTPERDMSPRPFSEDIQFFHHNGSMAVDGGQLGFLSDVRKNGATFTPLDVKPEQEKRAMLYVTLSETYQQLYNYEAETHEPSEHLREHLNQYYDEFVAKYGNLNEKHNAKFIMMDANGRDALALERVENGQFVKADIFDHPVSFSQNEVTSVEMPQEALAASLNKYGEVNMEYMADLLGIDKTAGDIVGQYELDLLEALEGRIYYNPIVEKYEIADRFIAGNVVQKAEDVKAWIDREEERIKGFPGYDGIEPYIGDALGLGSEFMSKDEVIKNYPDGLKNYDQIIQDAHRRRWAKGAWTDDTDMMLCILNGFENGAFNLHLVASNFKDWFNGTPMGIGSHTYKVLCMADYVEQPEMCSKLWWELSRKQSAANGALMRTSVVGLAKTDIENESEAICKLTHYDPRCVGSCVIAASIIHNLVWYNNELSYQDIKNIAQRYDERILEWIDVAYNSSDISMLDLDEKYSIGYTLRTLSAALWCYWHSTSFADGLLSVVNEGGDADTNSTIAGAILGAKFGLSSIPKHYIDKLHNREEYQNKIVHFIELVLNEKA